jgi:hypothetical protein
MVFTITIKPNFVLARVMRCSRRLREPSIHAGQARRVASDQADFFWTSAWAISRMAASHLSSGCFFSRP